MSSFHYKRAIVIGVTSSGKSTLAEQLAKRFDLNYIVLLAALGLTRLVIGLRKY